MAQAFGLLGDGVVSKSFDETWIAPAGVTAEYFYELRSQKNVAVLVEICQNTCLKRETSVMLEPGVVVAMMTDTGKYGMFLVRELTPISIQIDACHILL